MHSESLVTNSLHGTSENSCIFQQFINADASGRQVIEAKLLSLPFGGRAADNFRGLPSAMLEFGANVFNYFKNKTSKH